MVTVRLAGKGAGREVAVEGLRGATLVAELLARAAVALGAPSGAGVAVRCGQRRLRAEQTLAEAGVPAGAVVDVCVGECGGMPMESVVAEGAVGAGEEEEELAGALGALLGQVARDVSGMEGAVQRLEAVQDGTDDDLQRQVREAEAQLEAEGRRRAEAEARWRSDQRALAEAEARLRAAVERLRSRGAAAPVAVQRDAAASATDEVIPVVCRI
jgi:hypothetical protein